MKRVLTGVLTPMDPGSRPFVGALVLSLAHALCFLLAFPPFDAWFLALVAPLPLMVVIARTPGPWRSSLGALVGTVPMWFWHHAWIMDVTPIGFPLMVLYLSLYPAAFVVIGARLRARCAALPLWVLGPVLWAGLEVLRGELVLTGYPWFLIAHPLIVWLPFAWASAVVGVYALSAVTVLPSALVCSYLVGGWNGSRIGVVVTMFLAVLLSVAEAPPESDRSVRVIVVQTAVPSSNKVAWSPEQRDEDFVRTMRLTIDAVDRWPDAELIVWPETMFPGFTLSPEALVLIRERFRTPYADAVQDFSAGAFAGVPWLMGAMGVDGYAITDVPGQEQPEENWDDRYNSVFLIEGGSITQRYDKRRLAPFGEVLPYVHRWPWLERQVLALGARGMSFDLSAGSDAHVFETDDSTLLIGTPICFEAAASDVCRDLVYNSDGTRRAELLVNATNDGWFADHRSGRQNHLLVARWRAAENRTPVVRAANTGVSVGIDRSGQIVPGTFVDEAGSIIASQGPVNAWGAMAVDVRPGVGRSGPWLGGWLVWLLGLASVIGGIGAIVPRAKSSRPRGTDES